jgi:hypothetical protein
MVEVKEGVDHCFYSMQAKNITLIAEVPETIDHSQGSLSLI